MYYKKRLMTWFQLIRLKLKWKKLLAKVVRCLSFIIGFRRRSYQSLLECILPSKLKWFKAVQTVLMSLNLTRVWYLNKVRRLTAAGRGSYVISKIKMKLVRVCAALESNSRLIRSRRDRSIKSIIKLTNSQSPALPTWNMRYYSKRVKK